MNVIQSEPRIDCKKYAKCGKKSIAHCRKYRNSDNDCIGCQLIRRRKSDCYKLGPDGRELKRCSSCGEFLPLHRFYPKRIIRGEKVYNILTSACRCCTSRKVIEQRNKKLIKCAV